MAWGYLLRVGVTTISLTRWPFGSAPFAYFAMLTGFVLMCAAFGRALRPNRLELRPSGLTYVTPLLRRSWSWGELGTFAVEQRRGVRLIFVKAPAHDSLTRDERYRWGDPRQVILGFWRLDLIELCDTLNAARERWREPPSQPMSLS